MSQLTKEELLKNPLVKEIAVGYANLAMEQADYPDVNDRYWKDYVKDQTKPEWEITRFKSAIDGDIYEAGSTPQYVIKNTDDSIYSVKRMSDGVEFKIDTMTTYGRIKHFELHHGRDIWVQTDKTLVSLTMETTHEGLGLYLQENKKLFTTEDGVDIYHGDKYYYVWNTQDTSWTYSHTRASANNWNIPAKPAGFKAFSNEEATREYILLNKPCLSIKDLMNTFTMAAPNHPSDSDWFNKIPLDKLKQLVKSKSF